MRHIYFLICLIFCLANVLSIKHQKESIEELSLKVDSLKEELNTWEPVILDELEMKFMSQTPEEGLMNALKYYNIQHPDIVYSQAVLETGNFTSEQCTKYNNLFGLYNSKNKSYYSFSHWSECVKAYRDYIQYKYKIPSEHYYKFLEDIKYAKDNNYIDKVKQIERSLSNKLY